jgi:hypothetical protein
MINSNQQYSQTHKKHASTGSDFSNSLEEMLDQPQPSSENSRMTGRFVWVPTGINQVKVISLKYAEDSTPDSPIMCDSNGNNRIAINKINPQNASELEIQMLCAHLDATDRGTGSNFGTYNDLKTARMAEKIAETNNLSSVVPTYNQKVNELYNWTEIIDDYMKIVKDNDQKQYVSMKHISNIFNSIYNQK